MAIEVVGSAHTITSTLKVGDYYVAEIKKGSAYAVMHLRGVNDPAPVEGLGFTTKEEAVRAAETLTENATGGT